LIAEAALPGIVLGLYVVQRSRIGNLGKLSALVYAYTYVFDTFSVAYALLHHTRTYEDVPSVVELRWRARCDHAAISGSF
jgi:hypothetical protein